MVTPTLSSIIKHQSYPEPVLLVSTSLHKKPLNTFAGLFQLNQEQHSEVEEKVNVMNFFFYFPTSFWEVSEL